MKMWTPFYVTTACTVAGNQCERGDVLQISSEGTDVRDVIALRGVVKRWSGEVKQADLFLDMFAGKLERLPISIGSSPRYEDTPDGARQWIMSLPERADDHAYWCVRSYVAGLLQREKSAGRQRWKDVVASGLGEVRQAAIEVAATMDERVMKHG